MPSTLILPTTTLRDSYLEAMAEFRADGQVMDYDYPPEDQAFDTFVQSLRHPIPKPGHVPFHIYWLVDDDAFVGRLSIRPALDEKLMRLGGNIGYVIRPSQRLKGHGKEILRLGLQQAKALGLNKVLITCNTTNTGSIRIIEANGGVLENELENKRRYWLAIDASPS